MAVLLGRGLQALGGTPRVLPPAIECAVTNTRPRVLHMLLSVEGEDRRAFWANLTVIGVVPYLLLAAAMSSVALVAVLLASGANADARDTDGKSARDYLGLKKQTGQRLDRETAHAAICRMLERGPAFRARSWTYPSFLVGVASAAGGAGAAGGAAAGDACRDGDSAGARDDPPAGRAGKLAVRVRVYRPESGNAFARLLGR